MRKQKVFPAGILAAAAMWMWIGIAHGYVAPVLPQLFVDVSMPNQTGTVHTVDTANNCNGTNGLQAKIDAAQLGDTIVIPAGAVCTTAASYKLKNKTTGSGWIVIKSSRADELPQGVRVNPSQADKMAKIRSVTASVSPIDTQSAAHHYRLIGLEVAAEHTSGTIYSAVNFGNNETTLELLPKYLIIDRSYIHGTDTNTVRRGVALGVHYGAVINSYISNIHEAGGDSQAILALWTPGPLYIANNYLEGAGENVLFGGGYPTLVPFIPSDVTVRGNYFYKPNTWRVGHPSYAGISWTVKNLFEIKNGQRILLDGNVLDNSWIAGQNGVAILLNGVDGNASVIENITITNNFVRNIVAGVILSSDANPNPLATQLRPTNTVLVANNMFEALSGVAFQGGPGLNNFTINHNTVFNGASIYQMGDISATKFLTNFTFTNNIVGHGNYGFILLTSICGTAPDTDKCYKDAVIQKNVISNATTYYKNLINTNYPGNYFIATTSLAGFTNFNSGRDGEYSLAPTSDYKNMATDGSDIGVDWNTLTTAIAGAVQGTWNASSNPTPTPTPPQDTTPPVLSSFNVANITSSSAVISWTSSELADGQVDFGTTVSYGSSTALVAALTTSHAITLSGLAPSTAYHYRAKSRDAAGNLALSADKTFTTAAVVTLTGDFNNDGIVNSLDYSLLSRKWNQTANIAEFDLRADGVINTLDYALFLPNWGRQN